MQTITLQTIVEAPIEKVWDYWTNPNYISTWAFASDDWEAPHIENEVKAGGRFLTRMQAKDGSAGFDFTGTYTSVEKYVRIEYDMDKGVDDANPRHVSIEFKETPQGVLIIETFDPEQENPLEMQKAGWQAILDNFKKSVEA